MRSWDHFRFPTHWKLTGLVLFFQIMLLISGCGRWTIKDRVLPPPSLKDVEGIRFVGVDRPPEYEYRIGAGDILLIRFFYYPEMLEPGITVPSTGIIQLPLIGGLQVIGYNEEELNALLTEEYSERLMFPDVVARVTTRKHDTVYMDGVVAGLGALAYYNKLTLMESLQKVAMAGDSGALHSVIIIRGLNTPEYKAFRVNANKILEGKVNDIYLEPSDIVYVPKKFIFDVNYFVTHYIDRVLGQHIAPAVVFPQAFPLRGDIDYQVGVDFEDIP